MNGRTIAGHVAALTVVLTGVLIGCGVAPAPAPTPDPEGNGDPTLVGMPTAALLEQVSMPFTPTGTRADNAPEIKLQFAKSMNRDSVETAVNVYPEDIKRNEGTPQRLQVKALCDGNWQIRNPNPKPVSFTWSITKSAERGEGMVAANGVQTLNTSRGYKQLRVAVNDQVQARVLGLSNACQPNLEFTWAMDNRSVTVKPLKPVGSDAITVSISTAAFSSDGVRMAEPNSETLVPEQVIQPNQMVALSFAQSVNKQMLETSLKIYQGKFDRYNALETTALRVVNICDGRYTVKNPSPKPVAFTWVVERTGERGTGTVNANSETGFTPVNPAAVKVFTAAGVNVVRSLEESTPCTLQYAVSWRDAGLNAVLTPSTAWRVGSFTVTGEAVNDAGAKVARDRLAVVHVQSDTKGEPPGDPNANQGTTYDEDGNPIVETEEPLLAELSPKAFLPLLVAGENAAFDGTGSSDNATRYRWRFGDGEQLEGSYVEKAFDQPGVYPVTLTVSDDSGVSDSVTSSVTVMPSLQDITLETDLSGDNDTAVYDAGPAVPGLSYEWTITDADGNVHAQPQGARVNVRYPKLGSYEVMLNVLDYRDELGDTRSKRDRNLTPEQAAQDRINRGVVLVTSIDTRWALKPNAKLFIQGQDGTRRRYAAGFATPDAPLSLPLDASLSTGRDLKYTFEICQLKPRQFACAENRGVLETTSPLLNRNFTPGEYVVKLRVKDKYLQVDEASAYITVNDKNRHFVRLAMDNPILDAESRGKLRDQRDGTPYSPIVPFEGLENRPINESAYPFVITQDTRLRRASARWNAWENGGNFDPTLCKYVGAFRNRKPIPATVFTHQLGGAFVDFTQEALGWVVYGTAGDTTDQDLCDFISANYRMFFPPRTDEELLFSSGRWHQATYIDSIASLRVPKVMLSVLDDDALDGAANTEDARVKMLHEQYGIREDGTRELVYTVRLRASELQSDGLMRIEVPVYAVDNNGRLLNANGLFFGKFQGPGYTSDCGDCVMVGGKAMLTVTFRPSTFSKATSLALDLSHVQLQTDQSNCNASSTYLFQGTGFYQFGCSDVETSSDLPLSVDDIEPLPTVWGWEISVYSGRVLMGETIASRRAFYSELAQYGLKAFNQLLDYIPVLGSVKGFIESVNRCREASNARQRCDVGAIVFAGVFVMLDIIPGLGLAAQGLKSIGPLYKLGAGLERGLLAAARAGSGVARWNSAINGAIDRIIAGAIQGGARRFEGIYEAVKTFAAPGWKFLSRCAINCKNMPEGIFARLLEQASETKAAAMLNAFVEKTGLRTAFTVCGLSLATQFMGRMVWNAVLLTGLRLTLGHIINQFYDAAVPPEAVDDASSENQGRSNPRASRPKAIDCPTGIPGRIHDIENKYEYNPPGRGSPFNNWIGSANPLDDVQPFIGKIASKNNVPRGYLYGEHPNGDGTSTLR